MEVHVALAALGLPACLPVTAATARDGGGGSGDGDANGALHLQGGVCSEVGDLRRGARLSRWMGDADARREGTNDAT